MSVIDSIKEVFGVENPDRTDSPGRYHCQFCGEDYDTAYSFCPDCGSERVEERT
jgi:rRNA maturation endonuclease Nob1